MTRSAWCLAKALRARWHYVDAFVALKRRAYLEAWRELERAEIELAHLRQQKPGWWTEARLESFEAHVARWQRLFPYRMFISPELRIQEAECSICGEPRRLRGGCGHRIGEVYGGEQCGRRITKVDCLGIAIVTSPRQKYSLLHALDPQTGQIDDGRDYSLIDYAIARLGTPFDRWSFKRTQTRRPHAHYEGFAPGGPCPCGSSAAYHDCCMKESGVLFPHIEFEFFDLDPDSPLAPREVVWPKNLLPPPQQEDLVHEA